MGDEKKKKAVRDREKKTTHSRSMLGANIYATLPAKGRKDIRPSGGRGRTGGG